MSRKAVTLVQGGKRLIGTTTASACPDVDIESMPSPVAQPTPERQYTGTKISLEFKDADIQNVFRLIADVSGRNILVTDDVRQKVSMRLTEVPWDQALDLIVEANGLAKEEIGNAIRISTAARIATDRKAELEARIATRSAVVPQVSYLTVNYAKAKDLVDRVKEVVRTVAEIVPDERSNTIIVRGYPNDVREVACIVSRLDVRTPQVLIESNLIETTPSFARALGMELNVTWRGLTLQTGFTADQPFRLGVPATRGTDLIPATPAVPPSGLQLSGSESPLGPFAVETLDEQGAGVAQQLLVEPERLLVGRWKETGWRYEKVAFTDPITPEIKARDRPRTMQDEAIPPAVEALVATGLEAVQQAYN